MDKLRIIRESKSHFIDISNVLTEDVFWLLQLHKISQSELSCFIAVVCGLLAPILARNENDFGYAVLKSSTGKNNVWRLIQPINNLSEPLI